MSVLPQSEPQTIGEIASTLAGAGEVFRKHGIDFGCGGADSLDEAARKSGADPAVVRGELDALDPKPPDVPSDSAALCDHIVERYHDVHRRELPELIGLARRVEAAHADHPLVPKGLADALEPAWRACSTI
jgi:regulator of cell morphogenesis and NO signaling